MDEVDGEEKDDLAREGGEAAAMASVREVQMSKIVATAPPCRFWSVLQSGGLCA